VSVQWEGDGINGTRQWGRLKRVGRQMHGYGKGAGWGIGIQGLKTGGVGGGEED